MRTVGSQALSGTPRTLRWIAKSCVFSQVNSFTQQSTTCGDHDGAAMIFTSTQAAPSTPARMLLRTASHDRLAARSRLAGCRSRPIGRRSRSRRARALTAALQLTAAKRSERCGCVASKKHPLRQTSCCLLAVSPRRRRARKAARRIGTRCRHEFHGGALFRGPCRNRGDDRH